MATFSTDTQAAIDRAKRRTELTAGATLRSAVGFAQDIGDALKGIRDETGTAALLDATTEGDGDVARADSNDLIPVANLPDIPTDNLPTGDESGLIPVVGEGGLLPTHLYDAAPGGAAAQLRTLPVSGRLATYTTAGDHTITLTDIAPVADIVGVYLVAVGAGGLLRIPATGTMAVGYRGEITNTYIPRFALEAFADDDDQIIVSVGAAAVLGDNSDTAFSITPAEPSGIKNVCLARGGYSFRLGARPTEAELTAANILNGHTLKDLTNPTGRNITLHLSDGAGSTTTMAYSTGDTWGSVNTQGCVVLYWIVNEADEDEDE